VNSFRLDARRLPDDKFFIRDYPELIDSKKTISGGDSNSCEKAWNDAQGWVIVGSLQVFYSSFGELNRVYVLLIP
jgi:hypothetical protein